MVENNNNDHDDTRQSDNREGAPRRRRGLFGTRRARSGDGARDDGARGDGARGDGARAGSFSGEALSREALSGDQRSHDLPTDAGLTAHPESAHSDADHTAAASAFGAAAAEDDATFDDLAPSTRGAEAATAALGSVPDGVVGLDPMSPPQPSQRVAPALPTTSLLFQAPDLPVYLPRQQESLDDDPEQDRPDESPTVRRRSRRRSGEEDRDQGGPATPPNTVVKVRTPRPAAEPISEPQRVRGSTRLEAKKQRRRDGRDAGRRRPVITEAEFIARRESVERQMVVRSKYGRIQIGVLEDGVLAEHYVAKAAEASLIGNVYLGRVQNVLPSMEAAFIDIGRGRNAVLYSGEVDWEAASEGSSGHQARRIELALKPGDRVLVQVTKDPVGHKGARLTSQVSLPGRYLVYVPNGSMSGISRKLPDTERARLKKVLKEVLPENVGVIVRTAAEGATDEQLALDVNRLTAQWARISEIIDTVQAPALLHSEPDLLVKIVRDVFNEDFQKLVIEGEDAEEVISAYLRQVAPDLLDRIERYDGEGDSFDRFRISEQIEKALDRKVWLPSGGSLVMDRTEAMTVVDVNTGKFVGSGGNLEETVTKNNLEAAEELVRQLRLRDIGGIIVVDFIDMVLESNRDLVLRRLVECLSRDRTKHQVAEVTSLGLVQMTRKKLGLGLIESFSENCEVCAGRGIIVKHDPTTKHRQTPQPELPRRGRKGASGPGQSTAPVGPKSGTGTHAITDDVRNALAKIATSTIGQVPADAAARAAAPERDGAAPQPDLVEQDAHATVDSSPATVDPSPESTSGDPLEGAPAEDAAEAPVTGNAPSANPSLEAPASDTGRGRRASRGRGRRVTESSPVQAGGEGAGFVMRTSVPAVQPVDTSTAGTSTADTSTAEGGQTQAAPTDSLHAAPASVDPLDTAVAILDIPVKKQVRAARPISTRDAEQILDSVLDALPEPRQPGQGRSRGSRRASSHGTVVAPADIEGQA